jgi:hypothetical protein
MSRCVFDRDAIRLSAREAINRMRRRGFDLVSLDYRFFFPRFLARLRIFEKELTSVPLGAQYQVLCRKPAS